jgi:methylisocitrate lyase
MPRADQLIEPGRVTFVPLALDALTARIAQAAGFRFGYVSGGALGYAHAVSEALLTLDELADVTRHVTARSTLGIVVDAGVGFGDPVHLTRTVRDLEAAGAIAIEIEDQVAPKRVSHHRGIEQLVSTAEMVARIECAVRARRSPALRLIARTGAVRNESFDAACERANAYVQAGADLILIMPEQPGDWASARERIPAPLATFGALGARSAQEWEALGFSLVIDPFTAQVLAVEAVRHAYDGFMRTGTIGRPVGEVFTLYRELAGLAGFDEYYAIEDATTLR